MDTSLATAVAQATQAADAAEAELQTRVAATQRDLDRAVAQHNQLAAREEFLRDALPKLGSETEAFKGRIAEFNAQAREVGTERIVRNLYTFAAVGVVNLAIVTGILRDLLHYENPIVFAAQAGGAAVIAFGLSFWRKKR